MKKQLLTLMLTSAFSFIFAQDLGKLIIRNASPSYPKFIASLNGIRLSNDYVSEVTFLYLDEYNYKVKLLQSGTTNMLNFNIKSEPKYITKYVIMKDNFGNYSILLESKSLMMGDDPVVTTPTVVPNVTVNVNTPTVTPTNTIVVQTSTFVPGLPTSTAPVITNISDEDFKGKYEALKKETFERNRLSMAKNLFADEYITTNQVIELVKLFSFDDDRLNLAKWTYSRTTDKKNYYKVNDSFTFSRYKKELSDYVSKQPK